MGKGEIGLPFFSHHSPQFHFTEIPMILELPDRDESKGPITMLRDLKERNE